MATSQSIFVVNGAGELARMRPTAPPSEDALQELIERFPEIIGDGDGSLLLIQREQPIADSELSSGRWSVDHLFVTKDAVPVLVEVKRAVDTRLRREVVGQMLDYAANGVAYWPAGTVADIFLETCERVGTDPDEHLAQFLGDEADVDKFWSQVDANFRASRLKLVFVADEIPRELARIVEFLNEQMTAEVRAVELRYFEGGGGLRTLVPRIIGETERAQAQKSGASSNKLPPIEIDQWIEQHVAAMTADAQTGFETARQILSDIALELRVTTSHGSIGAWLTGKSGKSWCPVSLTKSGSVTINVGYSQAWLSEQDRAEFLELFAQTAGPLSNMNVNGYPGFPFSRLTPENSSRFAEITRRWFDAFRDG